MGDWTPRVAVDLDGVLAEYDGWEGLHEIGAPNEGAMWFMEALQEIGAYVIVHTTRINPDPFGEGEWRHRPEEAAGVVEGWLDHHGLPFDEVFIDPGKPIAAAYVDDRAVTCRPQAGAAGGVEFSAALTHVRALMGRAD